MERILDVPKVRGKVVELNNRNPFLRTYKGVYLQCIINEYKKSKVVMDLFFESSNIDDFFTGFEELENTFQTKYPIWDQVLLFSPVKMLVGFFNGLGISSYQLNGYLYIHLNSWQKTGFNVLDVLLDSNNKNTDRTLILGFEKVGDFHFLCNLKEYYIAKNFNSLGFSAEDFQGKKVWFKNSHKYTPIKERKWFINSVYSLFGLSLFNVFFGG